MGENVHLILSLLGIISHYVAYNATARQRENTRAFDLRNQKKMVGKTLQIGVFSHQVSWYQFKLFIVFYIRYLLIIGVIFYINVTRFVVLWLHNQEAIDVNVIVCISLKLEFILMIYSWFWSFYGFKLIKLFMYTSWCTHIFFRHCINSLRPSDAYMRR